MDDHSLKSLQERLASLEAKNHRWKRSVQLSLFIVASVFLMGQVTKEPEVIEAQRIILKDRHGQVRVILGAQATTSHLRKGPHDYNLGDNWGIHLYDSNGVYMAGLTMFEGGWLILKDKKTASRVDLSVAPGYADFVMKATSQTLQEQAEEDERHAKKWNAAKTPEERARADLELRPANHEARLLLSGNYTRFSLSEKGKDRAVLGRVSLERKHGVVEEHPISSLTLFDKDEKVVWQAPR